MYFVIKFKIKMVSLFILLCYGITNIIVFGGIFESWRNFWVKYNPSFFGKLFTCPLCLSTWVGFIMSAIFLNVAVPTPFTLYGLTNKLLIIFCDGCLTSGLVWIIHTIQEYFERSNPVTEDYSDASSVDANSDSSSESSSSNLTP